MTDRDPPDDQRQHPRYRVEIRVDWSTGQMFLSDVVSDISQGGVFLRSDRTLPLHEDIELVLWIPDGNPVRATGRVVWSHDVPRGAGHVVHGAGLQFAEIHPADRALLHDYLLELITGAPPERGH